MERPAAYMTTVGGFVAGAGLMYLMDPDRGRRRRAELRQKSAHVAREAVHETEVALRDASHRARGYWYELWSRLREGPVPDDVLQERVRATLGRVCSHPGSIEVSCCEGVCELKGPILSAEAGRVLRAVKRTRGVTHVVDHLERHKTAGNIPGLQGGAGRSKGMRPELLQENWAPAVRLFALMGGSGLIWAGRRWRGWPGSFLTGAGAAVCLRAITNLPFERLFGIGAGRRAIDVQKTIFIEAPIDEVFRFFRHPENFPRFMRHVRQVMPLGDNRYHWVVEGFGHVPFAWDAEITRLEENALLCWKTIEPSIVDSAGMVHFEPERGGTRVHIQLSYNPPAGALGHAFAKVFRSDPKHELDDDLLRLKSLLEKGKATGHDRTVTKEEVEAQTPELH